MEEIFELILDELEGHERYLQMSEEEIDPAVKAKFKEMALDEFHHAQALVLIYPEAKKTYSLLKKIME